MKLWVYKPRSSGRYEIHAFKETILEDMKDDLEWAMEEDPDNEGGTWENSDDRVFVDDGGDAQLVEIVGWDKFIKHMIWCDDCGRPGHNRVHYDRV